MNRLLGPDGDVQPASEGTLVYFASYLARTVRHSTIKLYLAAVRNLHITAGFNDPLKGKLLLRKVLRGILRYQGQQRIRRQPVTPQVLLAIRPVLQSWLRPRDFSMVWAAFNLAFFAFLRCSAAGAIGFGGYLQGKWFQGHWPPQLRLNRERGISIEWQELFPIVVACSIWHQFLAGKRLQIWCDNESVVSIINSGHSKVPGIMELVRRLVLLSMQHNFLVRARHLPGMHSPAFR